MIMPLVYEEGIKKLLASVSLDELAVIEIPYRHQKNGQVEYQGNGWRRNVSLPIPSERVFRYVPPNNVGCKRHSMVRWLCSLDLAVRHEEIPKLVTPGLTYLITDNQIHDGGTLKAAMDMTRSQGVAYDKQWFYVFDILDGGYHSQGYLDHAQVFLDYVKENPVVGFWRFPKDVSPLSRVTKTLPRHLFALHLLEDP